MLLVALTVGCGADGAKPDTAHPDLVELTQVRTTGAEGLEGGLAAQAAVGDRDATGSSGTRPPAIHARMRMDLPDLAGADAELASGLFDYVQFLLDDDAHLTPLGNLNSVGRERLRARLAELLDGAAAPTEEEAP